MMGTIPNTTDVLIDSRDVIARIEELEAIEERDDDENAELLALRSLADEASGYAADWEYGETLIRADYFEEYAKELAYDVAATPEEAWLIRNDGRGEHWPLTCARIDWEQAAEELRQDYTAVDFDGIEYLVR